jgi:hypothetical protein
MVGLATKPPEREVADNTTAEMETLVATPAHASTLHLYQW